MPISTAGAERHPRDPLALPHERVGLRPTDARDLEPARLREPGGEGPRTVRVVLVRERDAERRAALGRGGEDHAEENRQHHRPRQDEEQVAAVPREQPQVFRGEGEDGIHRGGRVIRRGR
jgi:hypothetical protein